MADAFAGANCVVLGASFDTITDNKAFKDKFGYPFELLSDVDEQVGVQYEVREPGIDKVHFAKRYGYLIDGRGAIVKRYDVGREFAEFAPTALADIRALS
jgi:peroxiredoxin Q/BCP